MYRSEALAVTLIEQTCIKQEIGRDELVGTPIEARR
jgi:hypothetical protein